MLYCIKVERELEEPHIMHHAFVKKPTRDDVLEIVLDAGLNYDDDYGRFEYWELPEEE